jgi:hypothetical protein
MSKLKEVKETKKHHKTAKVVVVNDRVLSQGKRLDAEGVKRALRLYKEGKTQHEIARLLGCSYGKIWGIVGSGKTYSERVEAHGGPLRTEPTKKAATKGKKTSNKKESALAKLKSKK